MFVTDTHFDVCMHLLFIFTMLLLALGHTEMFINATKSTL